MLILTRRVGETVVVGDNISVTVLGFKGSQVRLGIEAPTDVRLDKWSRFRRCLSFLCWYPEIQITSCYIILK